MHPRVTLFHLYKMIEALSPILWVYLMIQTIAQYNAIAENIFSDQLFTSSIHKKESLNNSSANWTSAQHGPSVTYFTHGTFETPEDNILSQERQTASVIFLHGSGGTGKKTKGAVLFLKPNHKFRHIKLIFPTAPLIPFTPENGTMTRVWFNKISTDSFSPEEPNTLANGITDIKELIQQEIAQGIPLNRIIIGGFSMGGAMSMNVAYRSFVGNSKTLAGVFALSAYLHPNSSLYEELREKKLEAASPLYYSHGKRDKRILHEWGNETFERLKSFGIRGEFKSQPRVKHRISTKGLEMLFEWLERTLP